MSDKQLIISSTFLNLLESQMGIVILQKMPFYYFSYRDRSQVVKKAMDILLFSPEAYVEFVDLGKCSCQLKPWQAEDYRLAEKLLDLAIESFGGVNVFRKSL